ncbi:MAG: hypothetical protein ACYCQK_08355 [Acidiferrobacteraceae bacterium]
MSAISVHRFRKDSAKVIEKTLGTEKPTIVICADSRDCFLSGRPGNLGRRRRTCWAIRKTAAAWVPPPPKPRLAADLVEARWTQRAMMDRNDRFPGDRSITRKTEDLIRAFRPMHNGFAGVGATSDARRSISR